MKNCILNIAVMFCAISARGQNVIVQLEQMEVEFVNENSIQLVHTLGEPFVGIETQDGISLISGYFPGARFDSLETSGIQEYLPIEGLEAYPNPVRTSFVLGIHDRHHKDFGIHLYDASGKFILSETWPAQTENFELSFRLFPAGTYYLRVSDAGSGRRSVLKVLKQ